MNDDATDIADAPADTGAGIGAPETAPDYSDEPVDLAELPPLSESDAPEVEEAPIAEDLSEPVAEGPDVTPQTTAKSEEAVDLGETPDTVDVAAEEPQDWQVGAVVDLGHDEAPEAPQEADIAEVDDLGGSDSGVPEGADAQEVEAPVDDAGEDLRSPMNADVTEEEPDSIDVALENRREAADTEPEASVEELTEGARDEARHAEELREEYEADVADVLADDAPPDTEIAGPAEIAVPEIADAPEPSDQAGAVADLGNSPENEALTSALAEKGLTLEPVDRFDYGDNPVLGYRESAPPEDVAYAVNTWNDQIAPGIAAGATRDEFAAYDQEHGLEGHQRLSGVYDYMLGDDAIKSGGEREDGKLDVTGGRHRLEQARLGGVQYLPVKN